MTIFAFGVAWMTVARRAASAGRGGLFAVLLLELVGVAWVCALYHVFFQPLPSILAIAGSFLLASGLLSGRAWKPRTRRRSHVFRRMSRRTSSTKVIGADFPLESRATSHEATVVVCDIANKHELAEDFAAGAMAAMLDEFRALRHRCVSQSKAPTSSQPTARASSQFLDFR